MSNPHAVWEAINDLREMAADDANLLTEPERALLYTVACWIGRYAPPPEVVQGVAAFLAPPEAAQSRSGSIRAGGAVSGRAMPDGGPVCSYCGSAGVGLQATDDAGEMWGCGSCGHEWEDVNDHTGPPEPAQYPPLAQRAQTREDGT